MALLKKLESKRLKIIPFTLEYLTDKYVAWLNDPIVTRYSEQRHSKHQRSGCKKYLHLFEHTPNYFSAIISKDLKLGHIGNISIIVDEPNSSADIAIMIGEISVWGQGYGFEAWQLVMNELLDGDTRKVTGGCMKENKAMIAILEKSGMTLEYIRPRAFLLNEVEIDSVHYAKYR